MFVDSAAARDDGRAADVHSNFKTNAKFQSQIINANIQHSFSTIIFN